MPHKYPLFSVINRQNLNPHHLEQLPEGYLGGEQVNLPQLNQQDVDIPSHHTHNSIAQPLSWRSTEPLVHILELKKIPHMHHFLIMLLLNQVPSPNLFPL